MLTDFIARAVLLFPRVIPSLKSSFFKTYDFMLRTIEGLVKGVYNGNVSGDFVDIMQSLITGQMTQAYQQAWEDSGETSFSLPDYLQSALQATINEQADFDFIYNFYQDIVDAKVDGTPIEPLLARAELWAQRYTEAYNDAVHLMELENGGKEEWVLGDTEQHCWICRSLNGIVMYAHEWEELGIEPQNAPNPILSLSNGDENGCGGWRCDCRKQPTDRRRTPKGFNTVLNLIGQ